MRNALRIALLSIVLLAPALQAAPPARWISRGPGGGGAFFGPAINPYAPDEIWVGSDMSDLFVTRDFGRVWDTVDFRVLQGGSKPGRMEFTSDPLVRYALHDSVPMRSADGGATWTAVPHDIWSPWVYGLWADPTTTNRLFVADYTTLFLSTNSGAAWRGVFTNDDHLITGVFWDGPRIYVGTRAGLLVSTNGGAVFAAPVMPGVVAGEAMISFSGAKAPDGALRFLCVTWNSTDVYPGVQGSSYDSYQKIYRLDGGTGSWTVATNDLGANRLFLVALVPTNPALAYAAGSDGSGQPSVVKTVDGGNSWTQVLRCSGNENIATGWSGDDSGSWNWKKWSFGECAMGFALCPTDPGRAVITDFGFIHVTTNGGASWRQAYDWHGHENPAGAATPKTNFYCGNGLEDTSCWWLDWFDSNTLFAGFTDIRGMWSTNGGRSWMSPMSLTFNSTYATARHPNGIVYAAGSSVHDLYAWDTYCQDARLDAGSGAVLWSTNSGATWATFKNLGRPVVHVALDPNRTNRLYAAMVHSTSGGIYRTTNLAAGLAAVWTKLAVPPRTQGHPYNLRILNDGALLATYSARIASNDFQPSAGVFLSTNDGASWLDRTATNMQYYTKDLALDPHDPAQNTWYAGVWGEWGASEDKGGLYVTTNRGVTWTLLTSTNLRAVGSATIDPVNPDEMYVTTEDQGLWYSANRRAAAPVFTQLDYPFRFPTRVFFNPHDPNEIWVTSFGNGLRLGRRDDPLPRLSGLQTAATGTALRVSAAPGQHVRAEWTTNLLGGAWTVFDAQLAVESEFDLFDPAAAAAQRFYRSRLE